MTSNFKKTFNILSITTAILASSQVSTLAADYDIYEAEVSSTQPSNKSATKSTASTTNNSAKNLNTKNTQSSSVWDNLFNPKFEGHILAEYIADSLIHDNDKIIPSEDKLDLYLNLEALFRLKITEGFFAETKWQLSPVNDLLYTGNIYADNAGYIVGNSSNSDFYGNQNYIKRKFQFSSYGLAVETLNFGYKNEDLALVAGKINPTFGKAFDKSRFAGVYGVLMPEEYELTGKIGGYVAANLPIGTLTFNTFFDDTTTLSRTMFNNIGKNESVGGAGNTEKFNNFSFTYDGNFDNLSLNLGFRLLETDIESQEEEKGFVAGAEYLIQLPYNINILPFFELAYFENFEGMANRNVSYLTTFLPVIMDNWHFIFTNTTKLDREDGYKNYTSHLTQLSLGYKFDIGLMVDVARIWEREVKKADGFASVASREKWLHNSDSWALMVSYSYKF